MAKDNDSSRADSKPQSPRQEYGKTGLQEVRKPREQAKLGAYPKRRSDDEY